MGKRSHQPSDRQNRGISESKTITPAWTARTLIGLKICQRSHSTRYLHTYMTMVLSCWSYRASIAD